MTPTVEIRGRYVDSADRPRVGRLVFTPTIKRRASDGYVVVGDPIEVPLVDGAFSVALPATDAPGVQEGLFYRVEECFPRGETFLIEVPLAFATDGLDVSAIDVATETPGTPAPVITRAEWERLNKALQDLSVQRSSGAAVAALGDSIMAAPVVGVSVGTLPPATLMPGNSAYNQVVHRSMGRVVGSPALNFGKGGDTIAQILARVPAVIAAAPNFCIVLGGTNDIGGGSAQAAVFAAIDSLFANGHDALRAAGITTVAVTIPPRSISAGSAAKSQMIVLANNYIRRLARQRGIPLADVYSLLADPATGDYKPGLGADGIHPTDVGAKLIAAEILRVLAPSLPPRTERRGSFAGDPANLAPNALFLGATTQVSGQTTPNGWTSSRTAGSRSLVAGSSGDGLAGKWAQLAPSASEAAANPAWQVLGNFAAGFTAGVDRLRFSVRVQIDDFETGVAGSDGLHYVSTRIRFNGPNIFHEPMYRWACDVGDALVVWETVVPAGTTSIDLLMAMNGQATARWGEWYVERVI